MLHLIRHGEVENPEHVVYSRLPGYGLSQLGRDQAAAAGQYLIRRPIVAIWSSPLERALETAHLIAAKFQLPVRIHPDLTEWKMADSWAGIVWEDLPEARPGQLERYLETLGTVAAVSPLLGLLGTVIGMVKVFTAITTHGVGNPSVLAGGIAEALITTAAGLTVAIPALIGYRYYRTRVDTLVVDMEKEAIKLVEALHRRSEKG